MRLQIDQPTRARDGRMLGRDLVETQPQKAAERERIRRAPRNAPLGIDNDSVLDETLECEQQVITIQAR